VGGDSGRYFRDRRRRYCAGGEVRNSPRNGPRSRVLNKERHGSS